MTYLPSSNQLARIGSVKHSVTTVVINSIYAMEFFRVCRFFGIYKNNVVKLYWVNRNMSLECNSSVRHFSKNRLSIVQSKSDKYSHIVTCQ